MKRVYRSGNTLTLMPVTSTCAPMVYTNDQPEQIGMLVKAVNFPSTVK